MTVLDGRYEVFKQLSAGGFGITYLARDLRRPGQPQCVVKQLRPQREFSPDEWHVARRLFDQEAEILERLGRHDQIPLLLAHFEENGNFFIVQDFIQGQPLRDELQAVKRLPEKDVITLLRQGLTVLSYVHQQGVIHRDIKPENLIRRQDGVLCLIDFGIVKEFSAQQLGHAAQPQSQLIATTVSIGTEGYTPREQAAGKPLPASDVYALGMVALEALTGRYPIHLDCDPNTGDVLWQQGVRVSESLAEVLNNMVRYHYSRRYATGIDALNALQTALGEASPPQSTPEAKSRKGLKGAWASFRAGWEDAMKEEDAREEEAKLRSSNVARQRPVQFEVVTVNETGNIINRENREAQAYDESLANGVMLSLVHIPAGSFIMGSPDSEAGRGDSEDPQRQVTVPAFWMGQYAVTQAQYQAVMGKNPSWFKGVNRPVENVSWEQAAKFCKRLSKQTGLNYRLPSEAEWEYACRADTVTPFHFGPTLTTDVANYNGGLTYGNGSKGEYRRETLEVGHFPPNAFGLYEMHGNVWEWCADIWHDNYQGAPTDGQVWILGGDRAYHVLRGGSWGGNPGNCRSGSRMQENFGRNYFFGFRVVCSGARQLCP